VSRSRVQRRKQQGRRLEDDFGRRAKREGYPARSIYKLEEIDQKVRLFRRGQRVLDLGASPGSWTLYAAERVGREGKVRGLDIQAHRAALPPNATIEVQDVRAVTAEELGGRHAFEVVLSDMAPATIGHRDTDMARSYELFMVALDLALRVLAPGGAFVGKIFQGGEFQQAHAEMKRNFKTVKVIRPKATREMSYEVFLVGLGRKEPATPTEAPG
jgi:23S rRNA (uridine2552-2'-O)-methyltransferase